MFMLGGAGTFFPKRSSFEYINPDLPIPRSSQSSQPQEKQELLQRWVQSGENLAAVECELQVLRKQQGELEHGRELLTIAEMQAKGFSQSFV